MRSVQWRGLPRGERRYGDPIGPPATITREPGQSRKAAATAGTLCAGVWLVGLPPISKSLIFQGFVSKKSRSVTAFRYTKVVHHKRHIIVLASISPPFGRDQRLMPVAANA